MGHVILKARLKQGTELEGTVSHRRLYLPQNVKNYLQKPCNEPTGQLKKANAQTKIQLTNQSEQKGTYSRYPQV